jgi:hypothetical protein
MPSEGVDARVLIIEDTEETYQRLSTLLSAKSAALRFSTERLSIEPGNGSDLPATEEVVRSRLLDPNPTSLVLLDLDLSKFPKHVAREFVQGVCSDRRIPICVYNYRPDVLQRLKDLRQWQEEAISITDCGTIEELAERFLDCIGGFMALRASLSQSGRGDFRQTIRQILQCPKDARIQLDQYFWGRFEPLQVAELSPEERVRVFTTSLGYWVYNVLLRFPGVLLGVKPAASYLDIDVDAFCTKPEIQKLFDAARYKGPFSGVRPYWWASSLDQILAEGMVESDTSMVSGNTHAERRGLSVPRCRCLRGHDGAGYFCIIRQEPVCAEHSVRPSGWLPVGADRSRIEQEKYDELNPWLAL